MRPRDRAVLIVRRSGPLRGDAALVGDKSISHRALILGAVASGLSRIANLSPCADVARTREVVRALGVRLEPSPEDPVVLVVAGRGPRGLGGPPLRLDCGDSGTTMRLLAGLLAGQDRVFTLDGAPGLRRRPMARVVEPLRAMGAEIRATDGRPPIEGRGRAAGGEPEPGPGGPTAPGLRGADIGLETASAQVGSALLLAGLNAAGETRIHYPAPVRDHTERMLAAMGAPLRWDGRVSVLRGPVAELAPLAEADGAPYRVPEDISAAAFLLAAGALLPGSLLRLDAVGVNPGRTGWLDILAALGASVSLDAWALQGGEPLAALSLAAPPALRAAEIGGALVPRTIDELPLLAVLATQARGTTVLHDAGELRVKECDRIAAMAEGLGRMGARIEARADGWRIEGPTPLRGARVAGHGDHRIVMALAVAGLAAEGETVVEDAERVGDSFPGFVGALRGLGAGVEVRGG